MMALPVDPWITTLDGVRSETPIKLQRGINQGSPISGLAFISVLDHLLKPLLRESDAGLGTFLSII